MKKTRYEYTFRLRDGSTFSTIAHDLDTAEKLAAKDGSARPEAVVGCRRV